MAVELSLAALEDISPKRDADAVPGTPPDLSPLIVGYLSGQLQSEDLSKC